MEQWAEIRRLHFAEGVGVKTIARELGLARNTVRDAVRSSRPPKYEREPAGSAVDAVEPQIRVLLQKTPAMPATVIAERIGWTRGMTILRDRVAELRPLYLHPEGTGRTTYEPGELAQWDLWQPPVDIPVGLSQTARPPVIVGVPGFSRWILARMIPSKQTHDVLGGHRWCLEELGAVPKLGVYDGEPAISSRRGGAAHPAGWSRDARRGTGRRPSGGAPAGRADPARGHVASGTLADNLRLVAGHHDERSLDRAVEQAGLAGWAACLPDGLDTRLGEGGANLSAGERQLVALARAALADPDVLILDEATADVDPVTEATVAGALARLGRDRSLIVVAHRPATAARADRVVTIEPRPA